LDLGVKKSWWLNESVQSKVRIKWECLKDWSRRKNVETWENFKRAKKETKKTVSKARTQGFGGLYQSLGTKEGENKHFNSNL